MKQLITKNKLILSNDAWSLIRNNANVRANKLESVPFTISNTRINALLQDSDFMSVRHKNALNISLNGISAVGLIPDVFNGNSFIVSAMKVMEHSLFGNLLVFAKCNSGIFFNANNHNYEVDIEYFYKGNTPWMKGYISLQDQPLSKPIEVFEFALKGTKIPVKIFKNNSNCESDVDEANVYNDLLEYSKIANRYFGDYILGSAMPYINTNFTDIDESRFTELRNGEVDALTDDTTDAAAGRGVEILPANGNIQASQIALSYLERKIKLKLGMSQDNLEDGGSNKHNLEISMKNEYSTELLESKRVRREAEWNDFFAIICPYFQVASFTIKLEFSVIEQSKIDFMKASLLKLQADAKAVDNKTLAPNTQNTTTDNGTV